MKLAFLKSLVIILIFASCGDPEKKQSEQTTSKPTTKKTFEYLPQEPEDGKLMGVIEIGSLGLNYFIINIDSDDRWSLVKSEFGRSNLIFGERNFKQIINTISAFKKEILANGVSNNNLHIVASSSAVESDSLQWLQSEVTKQGLELVTVNAKEEANYALIAAVPGEFARESFLVDMGSGNTKLSWTDGSDTTTIETFGSKYYTEGVQDTTVFREVRNAVLQIPEKNRNLCFMIGGMPFEFASQTEPNHKRYTILKPPTTYNNNGDRWNAGVVIYSALYQEFTYSYIFDWNSNFSVGYLISIN